MDVTMLPAVAKEEARLGFTKLRDTARRAEVILRRSPTILPGALIIGAQKAGTTYLESILAASPGVISALRKEPHYFDYYYAAKNIDWYRTNFPLPAKNRTILIDATPSYCCSTGAAARAVRAVPDAQIFLVIRSPTDRAFSHYQMQVRRGRERRSFHDAITDEFARHGSCQSHLIDFTNHRPAADVSYTRRGEYVKQLADWSTAFKQGQVHVVDFQRMVADPEKTLTACRERLGLQHASFEPTIASRNSGNYSLPAGQHELTKTSWLSRLEVEFDALRKTAIN